MKMKIKKPDYFVLQSNVKLLPNQRPYNVLHTKDAVGRELEPVIATSASIKNGTLEWIIPDNPFNQSWISQHYAHFNILLPGEETTGITVPVMAGMNRLNKSKEKWAKEAKKGKIEYSDRDQSPIEILIDPPEKELNSHEIKKLKTKLIGQLTELGAKFPKNSTLKNLQVALEKAEEEILQA